MVGSRANLLRAAGLRRTDAREAVLIALEQIGAPVTHHELAAHLERFDPVTLYRTLATLERVGLVHRARGLDGTWRYCPQPREPDGCPGNHVHFLCERCGVMACLTDQSLPRVDVPPGFRVTTRQFVASGVCARCEEAP